MRPEGEIRQASQAVSNELQGTLDLVSLLTYGPGPGQELIDKRDRLMAMNSLLEKVNYLLSERNPMEVEGTKAVLEFIAGNESEISGFVQNLRAEPQNG